jgi:hypothetical protein
MVAVLLAGCGSAPATPAPSTPPAGPPTAPAAASAAPTPAPTPSPTPVPTPVPVWSNYTVPDGRSATIRAVGTDGTVYVSTFKVAADFRNYTDEQLVALGADGKPRTGWTAPTIPAGTVIQAAVAGPDGVLFLALGTDFQGANPTGPVTILRLNVDGSVAAGWPVMIDTTNVGSTFKLAGPDLLFTWSAGADKTTLERVGPDGARRAGWPLQLDSRVVVGWGADAGGAIYVGGYKYVDATNGRKYAAATLIAYGVDGQPLSSWQAPTIDDGRRAYGLPIASGVLAVEDVSHYQTDPTKLVWLNTDGTPAGPVATGPEGDLGSWAEIGPGGVPYVTYSAGAFDQSGAAVDVQPGSVVAYGPDGRAMPGWPVKFQGWPMNGWWLTGSIGTDGTVWVIERFNGFKATVHAVGPDGKPRLAAPLAINADFFTGGLIGPSGAFYVTDRTKGTTTVIAVKVDGS